ncbi:MAG: HlyC/CorC family transporter [Fibrobacteraceae bacterium]|nr:HlyC/CorC family transporter [Fibrobacteraceae bacterium]
MDSLLFYFVGFLVCLTCSACYSLTKVVFLNRKAVLEPSERDEKIAKLAGKPGFIETISIGRICFNLSAGVFGFLLLKKCAALYSPVLLTEELRLWVALAYVIVAGFLIYLWTVLIPNILGNLKPGIFSVILLPLFSLLRLPVGFAARFFSFIYARILRACGYDPKLNFLSEEQKEAIQGDMTSPSEDSPLEEDERQMILNIFDFVETPVREIMTPRVDMCAIDVSTSLEKTISILNNERHSRLPVYRDSIDNIVGILSNRDFLEWYTNREENENFDLEKLVMPAIFVPYHKKIDDLLTELRRNGNQLAIVVDEYGGTAGLVTVEDILEEIVGEIRDEDDDEEDEDVQKLKDGRYILDPLMTLSDLEYELGVALSVPEHSHVETLSGLIQATLGTIPIAGTEVVIDGYKFRVLKVDGTRMEKVLMILPETQSKK